MHKAHCEIVISIFLRELRRQPSTLALRLTTHTVSAMSAALMALVDLSPVAYVCRSRKVYPSDHVSRLTIHITLKAKDGSVGCSICGAKWRLWRWTIFELCNRGRDLILCDCRWRYSCGLCYLAVCSSCASEVRLCPGRCHGDLVFLSRLHHTNGPNRRRTLRSRCYQNAQMPWHIQMISWEVTADAIFVQHTTGLLVCSHRNAVIWQGDGNIVAQRVCDWCLTSESQGNAKVSGFDHDALMCMQF